MERGNKSVIDMGLVFDGRCAMCRGWINPGDHLRVLDKIPEGAPHGHVHANAEGTELPCANAPIRGERIVQLYGRRGT